MQKQLTAMLVAAVAFGVGGSASAQTVVTSDVTVDTTWGSAANPSPIILSEAIFVRDNATLTILPGTIVRGQPRSGPVVPGSVAGTPGALIVTREGTLIAEGTPASPIIMTTAAVDNDDDGNPDDVDNNGFEDPWTPGDVFYDDDPANAPLAPLNADGEANVALWGGVAILGSAPTNLVGASGASTFPGEGVIEGLTIPGYPEIYGTYGGDIVHDSSGRVRYLSVRHAGDELGDGNELNGVSLGGVGDGTVFEYVEVYCNFDDGFEWFGGTLGANHLHVAFAGDDSFDVDQGNTGISQFMFAVMPFFNENDGTAFGSGSGDKIGEWDGDDAPGDLLTYAPGIRSSIVTGDNRPDPTQSTIMYNLTGVGTTLPGANPAVSAASDNRGVQMRNGFGGEIRNSIIVNTGTAQGFDVDGGGAPGFTVADNTVADYDGDGFGDLVRVVSSTFDDGAALPAAEAAVLANGDALTGAGPLTGNVVNFVSFPNLVNEDQSFDPQGNADGKLDGTLKAVKFNPRPNAGIGATVGASAAQHIGTRNTAYRGAFGATEPTLWTTGWTALSIGGILAD
jgi:hypothetical protein